MQFAVPRNCTNRLLFDWLLY